MPEIGYVQGMNYLAGVILKYSTTETSVMIMLSLFDLSYNKDRYLPNLPGL